MTIYYIKKGFEISVDYRQWMLGFNAYDLGGNTGKMFNIFLGPFRLGWWEGWERFWQR